MKPILRLLLLSLLFTVTQFPLFAQDQFHEVLRIGRGAVQHVQWQPNGQLVLVDTVRGAWLYAVEERRFADMAHIEDARLARFSPDGNVLAGVNAQNEITLWNTTDFAQIATRPGHAAYVRALEWSPSGGQLASVDRTGRLLVWNVASAEPAWEAQFDSADQIGWSRGGSYLAGVDTQNGIVKVWNTAGELIFTAEPDYFSQFGFDILWRNDVQLLRRNYGEVVSGMLWNAETGETTSIRSVGYASDYSPDGAKFAQGYVGSALIKQADTDETLFSVRGPQAAVAQWSPDGQYVAFGGWTVNQGTSVIIVDAETGEVVSTVSYENSITAMTWKSDGMLLLVVDEANQISLVDIRSTYASGTLNAHTEIGEYAAWRSDGQVIAIAVANNGSHLWDTKTGQVIVALPGSQPASKLVWQPGGTLLATASEDTGQSENNNVYIWDTILTQDIYDHTVIIPHVNPVAGLAWSPDGATLATIEQERFLCFWQPDYPAVVRTLDLWAIRLAPYIDYSQRIHSLLWSSGSDRLAYSSSGNYGGVNIIDAEAGVMLAGDTPVNTASTWAWTADNQFIWATWLHTTYPGGSPLDSSFVMGRQPLSADLPLLEGLPGKVVNAIFSSDASLLIGFDSLNNGIIWDVESRTILTEFANISDAVWSPDNTMLAAYGTDGLIRVIDVQTGVLGYEFAAHFRAEPFYTA